MSEQTARAALSFYAWLFDRDFSPTELQEFLHVVERADLANDQVSLNIVIQAARRWELVEASGGGIRPEAYFPEALTLLRELRSPLAYWLVDAYEATHKPVVSGIVPLTDEITDALYQLVRLIRGEEDGDRRTNPFFSGELTARWSGMSEYQRKEAARAPNLWLGYCLIKPELGDQWAPDVDRLRPALNERGLGEQFDWGVEATLSEDILARYQFRLDRLGVGGADDPLLVTKYLAGPKGRLPDNAGPTAFGPADNRDQENPPRTAWGTIKAPPAVVVGEEFSITVGLAPEQEPGVADGRIVVPPEVRGAYNVEVHVLADGFNIRADETWRRTLRVTKSRPYPTFELNLTGADPGGQAKVFPRTIEATYAIGGQIVGRAYRSISVVRDAALIATARQPEMASGGASITMPIGQTPADLTIVIREGSSEGKLLWTFASPHKLTNPDIALESDIGGEADAFATGLVAQVGVKEGKKVAFRYLRGKGREIADHMPPGVWPILNEVVKFARKAKRLPTVLILSEEPYVPWELAVIEDDHLPDPSLPPFLGAQTVVGRWILGRSRPKQPPPQGPLEIRDIAVISGEYNIPGWENLEQAILEAKALEQEYGAKPVDAQTASVLDCLEGKPPAQVLHFAVHGTCDPNTVLNGLILADGGALDPAVIRGSNLKGAPFVFLNSCQVGGSYEMLGSYSGMASAFLMALASGVIAPIWSVKDDVARDIALHFYAGVFAGTSPAELLRRERARFNEDAESATFIAYLFYGHPSLVLKRIEENA